MISQTQDLTGLHYIGRAVPQQRGFNVQVFSIGEISVPSSQLGMRSGRGQALKFKPRWHREVC